MRPPGLVNAAGNLCYLNATLQARSTPFQSAFAHRSARQAIASSPPLVAYLAALDHGPATPVIAALRQLLQQLNHSPSSRDPPLRPVQLLLALAQSSKSRHQLLASSEQQDAHELFTLIMDALEEEVEKLQLAQRHSDRGFASLLDASTLSTSRKGKEREIRNPYLHLLAQTVKCFVCGYRRDIRHVPEQLTTLHLPPVSSCTLEQCLDEYTKIDPISEYSCRRCTLTATYDRLLAQQDRLSTPAEPDTALSKSKRNRLRDVKKLVEKVKSSIDATDYERDLGPEIRAEKVYGPAGKELKFARTPEIFSVHVQRSAHFARGRGAYKNGCHVTFPPILDLAPFSTSSSDLTSAAAPHVSFVNRAEPNGKSVQVAPAPRRDLYRLSSVVVHYGTHSYGHYITYRRTPRTADAKSDPKTPTIAQLLSTKLSFNPPTDSVSSSSDTSSSSDLSSPSSASSSSSSNDSDAKNPFITVTSSRSNAAVPPLPSTPAYHDNAKSDWYRISDETVDKTDLETVLQSNPFLIFYEKIREDSVDFATLLAGKEGAGAKEGIVGLPRVVERWSAVVREEGAAKL